MASNHHPSIAFAFGSRNPFWSANREVDVYKSTINTVEVKSQLHLWIVISCDIVGRAAWNLYNSSGKREASLAFLPQKKRDTWGPLCMARAKKYIQSHSRMSWTNNTAAACLLVFRTGVTWLHRRLQRQLTASGPWGSTRSRPLPTCITKLNPRVCDDISAVLVIPQNNVLINRHWCIISFVGVLLMKRSAQTVCLQPSYKYPVGYQ